MAAPHVMVKVREQKRFSTKNNMRSRSSRSAPPRGSGEASPGRIMLLQARQNRARSSSLDERHFRVFSPGLPPTFDHTLALQTSHSVRQGGSVRNSAMATNRKGVVVFFPHKGFDAALALQTLFLHDKMLGQYSELYQHCTGMLMQKTSALKAGQP